MIYGIFTSCYSVNNILIKFYHDMNDIMSFNLNLVEIFLDYFIYVILIITFITKITYNTGFIHCNT